jgi:hypothetical protein
MIALPTKSSTSSIPAFPHLYFSPLWTPLWAHISVFAGINFMEGYRAAAPMPRYALDLDVGSAKDGVNSVSYWSLPAAEEQQQPMKEARCSN